MTAATALVAISLCVDAISAPADWPAAPMRTPPVHDAPSYESPRHDAVEIASPAESADIEFDPTVTRLIREQVREEMRDKIWMKGQLKIVPYGTLWTDIVYANSRTFPGRFILWIPSEETQGEATFQVEARYSRFGVNLEGPKVDAFRGLRSGGKIEVDFLGNFVAENRPDVRLRHAYWEVKNDEMRILAGQTWDLISPRLPNTVNFTVGWAAGNIGFRRGQIRFERYVHVGPGTTWTMQGALAQNVIEDFSGASSSGVTRETGDWPMIQGRTELSFERACTGPIEVGISGHIGETGFDFAGGHPANPALGPEDDARFLTWSFNVDARVPISERLGVHGEFFTGSNLSNEFGGILQGVCPCLRVPMRASGGWTEIWYHWNPEWRTHFGFGIDDPKDGDFLVGRTFNRFIYANTFVDLTERLVTGLEVSSWRTTYQNRSGEPGFTPIDDPTLPGKAVAINWTIRYTF